MKYRMQAQRGFSIVTAIFVIIVLGSMALFMATIGGSQQLSMHFSVLGARSLQAAASGLEWAIHDVLHNNAAGLAGCPGTGVTTIGLADPDLSAYTIDIGCASSPVNEAGVSYNVYALTVTASTGIFGTPSFGRRVLSATVSQQP